MVSDALDVRELVIRRHVTRIQLNRLSIGGPGGVELADFVFEPAEVIVTGGAKGSRVSIITD